MEKITTKEVMSVSELAGYLGIAIVTVYKKAEKGNIPGFKLGGLWRFRRDAIIGWMKEKEEIQKLKNISFPKRLDMLGSMIREGFKKAGYTQKDIPHLIAEVREKRKNANA